jgi:large subunit ribosomal protein L18
MRIRKTVLGTRLRPRLSLHFRGKHIYSQCIDDDVGRTLVYFSTIEKDSAKKIKINVEGAASFGEVFGKMALGTGIVDVVFDRGTKHYHGRVKEFADSVRNMGVKF